MWHPLSISRPPGAHIRANAFRYNDSIQMELTRIDKVGRIQAGFFSALGGFFLAVTIAVLNVLAQAWIGQALLED